MRNLFCL